MPPYTDEFTRELRAYRDAVDRRLAALLPGKNDPSDKLHRSVRHTLLAPAKRVRPVLALLTAESLGGDWRRALDAACALEMVHTASLILDDLPFMDDARTRRGRAACHHEHGVDMAMLASVYLLNRAFAVLAECTDLDAGLRADLITVLSRLIGDDGVIAGQVRDLYPVEGPRGELTELEETARAKTGALFVAAVDMGARIAGADRDSLAAVRSFAWNLGLCFQTVDDLLDLDATELRAGKDTGQDADKTTFVSMLGPDGARERAERYLAAASRALAPVGARSTPLESLAHFVLDSALLKVPER